MFAFIKNLFFPQKSSFAIDEVDHDRRIVILEDKAFGLKIEIPVGNKELKGAKIVGPYDLLLTFKDGTATKEKVLR